MFFILVLLFVAIPLLELALLIWVGQRVGVAATISLVVITGILGASLARHQGLATLERFRRNLDRGELPHRELVDGILILLAGAVLLTPGLLTDTAGFLLLVPPVRQRVRTTLISAMKRRFVVVTPYGPESRGPGPAEPIDVEIVVEDEGREAKRRLEDV